MRLRAKHKISTYWYWLPGGKSWGWRCRCGAGDDCWGGEEYARASGEAHCRWMAR